jgi:hypothetical protein
LPKKVLVNLNSNPNLVLVFTKDEVNMIMTLKPITITFYDLEDNKTHEIFIPYIFTPEIMYLKQNLLRRVIYSSMKINPQTKQIGLEIDISKLKEKFKKWEYCNVFKHQECLTYLEINENCYYSNIQYNKFRILNF